MRASRQLTCFIYIFCIRLVISDVLLFNLTSDSLETTDVASDPSYDDQLSYFAARTSYWSNLFYPSEYPSTMNMQTTYESLGGVGPWITSSFEPIAVTQTYTYEDAPHIVFVLIDDWGYNDYGSRSTYLSWTTPTMDNLASEGIVLENYYTYQSCSPTRAAFLTGRFALRTGVNSVGPELPLNETTLAQELHSAGYRTYMVGKWHVGKSTSQHLPTNRGFDYFYGFLDGDEDYYTKMTNSSGIDTPTLDLQVNDQLVTSEEEKDSSLHSAYLFENKAEAVIASHAADYPSTPMFLYYAMQLIHWFVNNIFTLLCLF